MPPVAARHAAAADLTLLMGLDLPWQADGHQRDSPAVREQVDGLLRQSLARFGIPHSVVYGMDTARTASALRQIGQLWPQWSVAAPPAPRRWRLSCTLECLATPCDHLGAN